MKKPKKKPTTAQMVGRIPKWLFGFEKRIVAQLALNRLDMQSLQSGQKMLSERMESVIYDLSDLDRRIDTLKPIVDHCQRLLREKEYLREMVQANGFMAAPMTVEPPTLQPWR